MHTDSHFVIGHNHVTSGKPCQDYATCGLLPDDGAYAVISDGCSTGGQTDVGARVLSLATAQAIQRHWNVSSHDPGDPAADAYISQQQQLGLAASQELLGCRLEDLYATCAYLYLSPKRSYVMVKGDGVVAWNFTPELTGRPETWMVRLEWEGNTPLYPAYAHDNYAGFIAHHGGDLTAPRLKHDWWKSTADGQFEPLAARPDPDMALAEALRGFQMALSSSSIHWAAIFTDGVTQVEGLDWKEAVRQLTNFKTTAGDFAKRRLNRFVKEAQKLGRGPLDDLSYAVILP